MTKVTRMGRFWYSLESTCYILLCHIKKHLWIFLRSVFCCKCVVILDLFLVYLVTLKCNEYEVDDSKPL